MHCGHFFVTVTADSPPIDADPALNFAFQRRFDADAAVSTAVVGSDLR